jgi:hypothetical protein
MSKIKNKWIKIALFLCPFIALIPQLLIGVNVNPLWQDEYTFYRITQELPSTATSDTWFWIDNPKTTYNSEQYWPDYVDRHDIFSKIYNTPIYVHSPIWNYAMWPIVKFADWLADKGVVEHIETDQSRVQSAETMTIGFRIIPIILFMVTMWFVFLILQRKVGNYAYFFSIPLFVSYVILNNVAFFYWDMFMWLLVVLTLYFQEKNSKWAYLTGCLLVNTKLLIGILLLIPFMIKNKKMVFCILSFVPYWIATGIVTGDIWWLYFHEKATVNYGWLYSFLSMDTLWLFNLPCYALVTLPIFFYAKKYALYCVLLVITIFYGWGCGISANKMQGMLISGALIFPIIAYEFNLIGKVGKLLEKLGIFKKEKEIEIED